MKVFLIRHAQSEENILDLRTKTTFEEYNAVLRRSPAAALTPLGEQQASTVAERMARERIERLYSSPFQRALATAAVIGAATSLTPQIVDDLREVLPSPLDKPRRNSSLRRHFIRSYLRMLLPMPGDQNWAAGYRRARAAWATVTAEPAAEIALVSHRGLIGLILLSLRRSRHWRVLQRDLSNGGVSVVVRR
ncbi:MAG: hypothetical protein OHK0022_36590 [Roseiflexaceae bacterium]